MFIFANSNWTTKNQLNVKIERDFVIITNNLENLFMINPLCVFSFDFFIFFLFVL